MADIISVVVTEVIDTISVAVEQAVASVAVEVSGSGYPLPHAASHKIAGSDTLFPLQALDMDTISPNTNYAPGRVYWDPIAKTLAVRTSAETTLQIGQETVVLARNSSLALIHNGTPVKLIGGDGTYPEIQPVSAQSMDTDLTIGVATQDIPINETGFVTAYGLINGMDTSLFSSGDVVFLGETGGLTNSKPTYPNSVIHIGHVVTSHESSGKLFVDVQPETFQKFFDVFRFAGLYSQTQIALSYSAATRQFTVTPTDAYWSYFFQGVEHRVTNTLSAIHTLATGLHYYYLDSSGDFVCSMVPWDIMSSVLIGLVYYNAVTGQGIAFDERHRISDKEWHRGQHLTVGTYYVSGLAANGYTLLSAIDNDIRFGVDSGLIRDEDLDNHIMAKADSSPYMIWYRAGVDGAWQIASSAMPYPYSTYAQYNQWTGSVWQLTQIGGSDFYNLYVVAIPSLDASYQIACIPGQKFYASLGLAQGASLFSDISWGPMPFVEFSIIHRFTLRGGSSYSSTGKVRIEAYADMRGTTRSVQVSGGASSSHNSLSGLNTGDYIHLTAQEYASRLLDAPLDGKVYGRQNGAWVEIL